MECDDSIDNDKGIIGFNVVQIQPLLLFSDGLIDCEDPECCASDHCKGKLLCMTVQDPTTIENHGPFSSFWDRIKFLVGARGIQRYAQLSVFDSR